MPNVVTPVKIHARLGSRLATSPSPDRINAGDEDDRNGRGGSFGREHPKDVTGLGDYGDLLMDQIGRQCRQPIVLLIRPAIFDGDIPTLDKARFAQTLAEGVQPAASRLGTHC